MKRVACVLSGVWLMAGLLFPAHAEDYPQRTVKLVAPFSPGGALDLIARSLAQNLSERWSQAVVVENRAGAAGIIGTEAVARAVPDGYTLLMGVTTTHGINPSLYRQLSYDAINDFSTISLVATIPHVLVVNPKLPIKTLPEFILHAQANPGMNFGSAGTGSPHHLAGEMIKDRLAIDIQHVPYKGAAPAMVAVMSGEVEFMSVEVAAAAPHIRSGKLRPIAIASEQPVEGYSLPTFAQAGLPGIEITSWYALFTPAGTDEQILSALSKDVQAAVRSDAVQERLLSLGATPIGSDRISADQHVRREIVRWAKAVEASGVRID